MPEPYLRQSPLSHLPLDARAMADSGLTSKRILIGEIRFRDMVNLRGTTKNRSFISAVQKAIGCTLPVKPNLTAKKGNDRTILSLGPNEWLIVTKSGDGNAMEMRLQKGLKDQHASVTSVGEGFTIIRLAGKEARNLLLKGCPLDLHPTVFSPEQCAQTLLARTDMILHCLQPNSSKTDVFDIYIARSFAEYVWSWIEDAGREYGTAVVIP